MEKIERAEPLTSRVTLHPRLIRLLCLPRPYKTQSTWLHTHPSLSSHHHVFSYIFYGYYSGRCRTGGYSGRVVRIRPVSYCQDFLLISYRVRFLGAACIQVRVLSSRVSPHLTITRHTTITTNTAQMISWSKAPPPFCGKFIVRC
jgi:hypothetical protein